MSEVAASAEDDGLRTILTTLRTPVLDPEHLTSLLAAPLAHYGLLPSSLSKLNTLAKNSTHSVASIQLILTFQRTILQHVVQTWLPSLEEQGYAGLLDGYFCPSSKLEEGGLVAIHAYTTLLLLPPKQYEAAMLARLVKEWPMDVLHAFIFEHQEMEDNQKAILWEGLVKAVFGCPGKVFNALANQTPKELEDNLYFSKVNRMAENIMFHCSQSSESSDNIVLGSLNTLFLKLINTGLFSTDHVHDERSFFGANLSKIRRRCRDPTYRKAYSAIWISVIASLPFTSARSLLVSLISSMTWTSSLSNDSSTQRKVIKRAELFRDIIGPLSKGEQDKERWDLVVGVLLGQSWPEELARMLVSWVAGARTTADLDALDDLLWRVIDLWTSPQHIKHSLLSKQRSVTCMLLLGIASFPPNHKTMYKLSLYPGFLSSMSTYLSHLDPSVRRCGMLVAEEVANRMGKKLDFGDWDGKGQGREWCAEMRRLASEPQPHTISSGDDVDSDDLDEAGAVEAKPKDEPTLSPEPSKPISAQLNPVLYDSDDSITGYASHHSSRSSSPSPSELLEIEKDPSLAVGRKKIQKPVYLMQLGDLLVHTARGEDQLAPMKEEMALKEGETLIRRKKGYGLELDENAVNLAINFVRLQDNFDIGQFDEKREAILTALVACCPERVAPCLIEQFFVKDVNNAQRHAVINALVFGARELAGLTPPSLLSSTFTSKLLPPSLHQKYTMDSDFQSRHTSNAVLEDITRQALTKGKTDAESKVPKIAREKQLRVRQRLPIGSIREMRDNHPQTTSTNPFNDIAAEFFIMPLINRFWSHLRDENARESRSLLSKKPYKGAGTAMVLDATMLSQLLSGTALLMHAARHSPAFLPVLAPEAIELAVNLGTRPTSIWDEEGKVAEGKEDIGFGKQASVLGAALEVTLVTLDACWDLDAGKTLGLEHTVLLLGVKEWSEEIFKTLERGEKLAGAGGQGLMRVKSAAAGVLLKLEDMISKWRNAMIQF